MSNAGFDWLTIDMEHNSIDPSMMQTLISTIQSKDIAALVRVSKNEEVPIKHALDAGADGIIVPMINNENDAKKAVEYAKYPPNGRRGVGLSRAQNYGAGFNDYKEWANENLVVIAQIEHIDGVNNLDKIISTKGIDAIIVGPYDLSGLISDRGNSLDSTFKTAMKVEEICKDRLGHKGVYPNVDFYSGILYAEMGISADQFTALFAVARSAGWLAHWREQD